MKMKKYICKTCGTQHSDSPEAPDHCDICEDERQYVGWEGQQWTTHEELVDIYAQRIEFEENLLAIGVEPAFAIDQRAFLLPTDAGNILWESVSIVTPEAIETINKRGGLDRIIISHPHFYSSMGEWSDAFDGVEILIHEADRQWVQRPHPSIKFWSGDELTLSDSVTLIRAGGHFPGSTVLHWAKEHKPGGVLFSGDALQVAIDRRHVSFMYSYPNMIPMRTSDVIEMRNRLEKYKFEDVFGYTWGRNIIGDGRHAVNESFDRYLNAVRSQKEEMKCV